MSVRNWCFTAFDDPAAALDCFMIRYCVYQKELCTTTYKIHWQGYVELTCCQRLSGVRKILPKAHWEVRKGTRQQSIDYCTKLETRMSEPIHLGTPDIERGGRTKDSIRLAEAKALIDSGTTTDQLCQIDFGVWIKHGKRLNDYQCVRSRSESGRRRLDLNVSVYWGRTATGKTRGVFDEVESRSETLYKLDSSNSLWWDGYMGEKNLLIDDFYGWIKFGTLLNILDIYPLRLDVKGGFAYAAWTRVYITSNKIWQEWYKDLTHEQHAALERRIHTIKVYD